MGCHKDFSTMKLPAASTSKSSSSRENLEDFPSVEGSNFDNFSKGYERVLVSRGILPDSKTFLGNLAVVLNSWSSRIRM